MLINAELLLQFQRCKRRSYLDIHGDFSQTDAANDLLLKLQQDKIVHQKSVLEQWNSRRPDYKLGDWQRGKAATLELMQQGVECIYQGVLLAKYSDIQLQLTETVEEDVGEDAQMWEVEDAGSGRRPDAESLPVPSSSFQSDKYTLLSRPDLLVKLPGNSCFGDWMYVPVNIELGKRPKQEYQVVAAFHAQVLAIAQQAEPQTASLVLRGKEEHYSVDLLRWKPQMHSILQELIQTLEEVTAPDLFMSRQRCNLCHWYSSCYAIAQSQKHLSLVPGITPVRYAQLQALGITTVESLAQANPTALENLPGFDSEVACKLVLQAQSVLQNRPLILPYLPVSLYHSTIPVVRDDLQSHSHEQKLLPTPSTQNNKFTTPIELYFDIEAQPDLNLDYLLGILVVDRQANTEDFYSLLAEKPEDEELIWQQFLDLMWQYPDAPIYHFCVYESDAVKRLAKLYRTSHASVQPILNRFVDIYEKLTQSVALPVESYALKAIARWLGFEWRDPEASGAKCIYWYDRWLKTGDRSLLEVIQRYNEDDCRATRSVKDWLVKFFQAEIRNEELEYSSQSRLPDVCDKVLYD
ncbi:MAG: TM0106 family RecB-like putative nuclease [Chlorogloeopsis fritschii C42_A2020_084]|uniref:TM0106 family RecB-like putative nuclease n=1 Tax=Chlorogloeopsis fritschii TaxID=1124 RepID=UPI0019E75FDD|nr:TM0106 family RecB-like putative nuclease [Chlorogloeopsis fritschii]MBF2009176.1 TM0106 family RecB-like putative nuclease [Chlorogloeopsis fritschii C42_A2020_084]